MRPGHGQPRTAGERGLAGEALVEQAAERVFIGAPVERSAFDLLGGEIGGCAREAALARGPALLVESPGQSEVGEIDVLVLVEQDVGGFDVAVDEAVCVCGVEGVCGLVAEGQGAARVERPFGVQECSQVGSLDVAHREIEASVDVTCVVDRDDVRVLERHRKFCFVSEAIAEAFVEGELGRHQLERDGSFQS